MNNDRRTSPPCRCRKLQGPLHRLTLLRRMHHQLARVVPLPREVLLWEQRKSQLYECGVKWRKDHMVGVHFVDVRSQKTTRRAHGISADAARGISRRIHLLASAVSAGVSSCTGRFTRCLLSGSKRTPRQKGSDVCLDPTLTPSVAALQTALLGFALNPERGQSRPSEPIRVLSAGASADHSWRSTCPGCFGVPVASSLLHF